MKRAGICLLIAFFLEIFLFNIRTVQSLFYKENVIPAEQIRVESFDTIAENVYLLPEEEECGMVYLTGLDALLGDADVHNVYLDWELPLAQDVPYEVSGICTIAPYLRDEGNDQYVELEDHVYRQDNVASKYLWFQGTGRIKTIVLRARFSERGALQINQIVLNAHRPLQVSLIRWLVVFSLLFAGCAIRKASWENAEEGEKKRTEMLVAILVGMALLLPAVYLNSKNGFQKGDISFRPYQQLAEAFKCGQTYLLDEPSQALKQMENPYDYTARDAAGLVKNVDYLWDTAYYEGRYYVYFGVLPCILFYLPYYAVTGSHMQDSTVILICAALLYAGIWQLLRSWCARRGKAVPYVMQMLAVVTLFMGSNVMACLGAPNAHDVPRMCGLAFLVWGLYFWISSLSGEKQDGSISLGRLSMGSLCMALAVGCRPNMALYSFTAPVLFWKEGKLFGGAKGKSFVKILCFLMIPYVPVAIGLMYYNAIRFGSVFDFGYVYNLTVHDYRFTVFSLDKLVIALHYFFIKLPQLDYVFPYMRGDTFSEIDRLGHTDFYITYNYGGLLVCNLILWCIPNLFGKKAGKSDMVRMAIAMIVFAMIQMFVNMMTGGVSYNYLADFALPLLLAGWEGAFLRWETIGDEAGRSVYKNFLILTSVWAFWFYANFYFLGSLAKGDTELYYRIFYAFNFF